MTPKEKAGDLINKYEPYVDYQEDDCFNEQQKILINAKQCAIICVDEIISEYQSMSDTESVLVINNEITFVVNQLIYWQEVKTEIDKL